MKIRWPILAGGMAVIAIMFLVLFSGFGKDPKHSSVAMSGQHAPPFVAQDLEGNSFDLNEVLSSGKPVVLNFWSTLCGPCKMEHPLMQQAARAFPNVQFLGVLYSDEPEAARRFLKREPSAYPTLIDPEGRMAIHYGVAGVPETFFINTQGQIIHKQNGPLYGPIFQEKLQQLVAK